MTGTTGRPWYATLIKPELSLGNIAIMCSVVMSASGFYYGTTNQLVELREAATRDRGRITALETDSGKQRAERDAAITAAIRDINERIGDVRTDIRELRGTMLPVRRVAP